MKKPAPKKTAKPPVIHHKPVAPTAPPDEPSPRRPRDRVQQSVYLIPAAYEQLRFLAFDRRVKMHDLLMDGLDSVFREAGMKTLDELKAAADTREPPTKSKR